MDNQALQDLPYDSLLLEVTDGPSKGMRFPLTAGQNILGRAPDAQIRLDDNAISRHHACVSVSGEDIKLEDMGSAQGTVLNSRLLMGADFLFDNDEIRIGPYTMRIQIQRRESRTGILYALACLGVALLIFMIAMLFPEQAARTVSQATGGAAQETAGGNWRNWETLTLPSAEQLSEEGLDTKDVDDGRLAEMAAHQFQLGTRLYQDRLGDLGNAYRSLLYYKRALSLANRIGNLAQRPAIANRSLERILELRQLILKDCEARVFAYQQKMKVGWWRECRRVLLEIMTISPWAGSRHNRWASGQLEQLDRMLSGG